MSRTPGPPGPLRRLAALLIRGPDASFIRADLDEAFERDLAAGSPRRRALSRYAVNAVVSAVRTWGRGARRVGLSRLDLTLAARMLMRQPALTLVAVFALAVGIPVGLLPMHVVESLTRAPPAPEAHELVIVRQWDMDGSTIMRRTLHDYRDWRGTLTSFTDLGMSRSGAFNVMSDDGRAGPIRGAEATGSFFSVLGVPPMLGRPLVEADEVPGAPDVVVLGHDVWRSRLAGDPDVIGRTIQVAGVPRTVVGVMPEGFRFPQNELLWIPMRYDVLRYARAEGPDGWIVARLAEGVSLEDARSETALAGERMALEYPDTHARLRPEVLPYARGTMVLDVEDRRQFWFIQVLALSLLALACGNVGILVLARTAKRTGEIAVRTALGASRARIVGQLFAESLVLAVLGASAGLLLGELISRRVRVISDALPFWVDFGVTPRTVAVALGLAALSAVLAGVVPALRATGRSVQRHMQRTAAGGSGVRFGIASSLLVVGEVAMAVWFISLAAAFAPSALSRPPGMEIAAHEYLSSFLHIPRQEPWEQADDLYAAELAERVREIHLELVARLGAESGVGAVALASSLPGQVHAQRFVEVDGGTPVPIGQRGARVQMARVDVGFFEAFRHPVRAGRGFGASDLEPDARMVIVNESFVDRILDGLNPVGQRIRYTGGVGLEGWLEHGAPGPWYEVVGVVGRLGTNQVNPDMDAGVYHPIAAGHLNPVAVALHVGRDPEAFVPRLREIAAEIDASALITAPAPLNEVFNHYRFIAELFGLLVALTSLVAVVLGAAGLYAIMAFTVAERTREIGIRSALGAQAGDIVRAIARRAFAQLIVGVVLGTLAGSWTMGRIAADGGEIVRTEGWPATVTVVALAVVGVGLIACLTPTRRGLRIRPAEALNAG